MIYRHELKWLKTKPSSDDFISHLENKIRYMQNQVDEVHVTYDSNYDDMILESKNKLQKLYDNKLKELNMSNLLIFKEPEDKNEVWCKLNDDAIITNLPILLAKVIARSRQIIIREHIKADRFEGVNLFINLLRSELGLAYYSPGKLFKNLMVSVLCRKESWQDIGIPSATANWGWATCYEYKVQGRYIDMRHQTITKLAALANNLIPDRDIKEEIISDIKNLELITDAMDYQLNSLKAFNEQADNIMDDFVKLCN